MDDVLKVLKQIVSSFSAFGPVPKPVRVCIGVFSGVFGFSLIFVYAHLTRSQTILLAIAIGVMALVTGGYYAWKTFLHKEKDQAFDSGTAQPASTAQRSVSEPIRSQPRTASSESFWDSPPRQSAPAISRPPVSSQPVLQETQTRGRAPAPGLLDLTEPVFQYICRLNRVTRRGPTAKLGYTTTFLARTPASPAQASQAAGLDEAVVRAEIKALLEDVMSKAATDLRLSQQARQIELPLLFFIDSMISESNLPFAAHWNQNRLAYERQELAGDEKFFDLLDETLKESGEDAAERLAVFYVCIGLGFTGIYCNQPELLRKTMLGILPRIRHLVENDPAARICPEAYQGVDTRDLVQPPGGRMAFVGLLFGCFTLAVLISYAFLYREASKNLNNSIEQVLQQDLAVSQPN